MTMMADDLTNPANPTDPTLARWYINEKRRAILIGVLAVVVLVLGGAVGLLTSSVTSNSRDDEIRACQVAQTSRLETRTAIIETIIILFNESDNPGDLAPTITLVQDHLSEVLPDRKC